VEGNSDNNELLESLSFTSEKFMLGKQSVDEIFGLRAYKTHYLPLSHHDMLFATCKCFRTTAIIHYLKKILSDTFTIGKDERSNII